MGAAIMPDMAEQIKKQVDQHLALTDSNDILAICQPMRDHFGLKSLVYSREYRDGRQIILTTHPQWVSYYFEQGLYVESVLEKEIDNYVKGHLLWSQIPTHSPILQACYQYGIANGLTLVRPDHQLGYCEFYFLGADPKHREFAQVCTNNMDLLDQFTDHFRYYANELIERSAANPIQVMDKYQTNRMSVIDIPCYQNQSLRHQFLAELNQRGAVIVVDNTMVKLSKRETDIAKLLLTGITMKQIAERCFISPRTVETHVDHLKQKLNTSKKAELIGVLKASRAFKVLL